MGDDIGSGSVTDCVLRSFSDFNRQTELHYIGWVNLENNKEPEPMSSLINYPAY